MRAPVPAPARGTLLMFVTKVDNKMHFNIHNLVVAARSTSAGDAVFQKVGYQSSEQTPILQLSSRDSNTWMLPPPRPTTTYGICYSVSFSCLPLVRLTPKQQSWEARNRKKCSWFWFLILEARGQGPRKGDGRQPGILGANIYAYECKGKLTPETNYSINFPNTGVETMLLQPPFVLPVPE